MSYACKLLSKFRWLAILLPLAALLQLAPNANAAAGSSAIAQGYSANSNNIGQGALVSIISSGSGSVEPANSNNATNLIGVAADRPVIELSGGSGSTIQVVVNGTTQALVSDVNGTVKVGDKITPSPVSGIGMKANSSAEIVGTALKDLSSVAKTKETVTNKQGKQVTIHVGLLPIAVNVAYYSASAGAGAVSSLVPPFLQNLANSVTGRQVSALRVLLGFIALILGFTIAVVMLYVSIRSDMISIGRNPLAESALRRGLVDVIVAAIGVLLVTAVIVYAVLL